MLKNTIITLTITLLFLSFIFYALFSCVRGSGNIVEREYRIKNYSNIDIDLNNFNVHIEQTNKPSLIIEAEDNILKKISIINKDFGTIKIKKKNFLYSLRPTKPIQIYISIKDIHKLFLNGLGIIDSKKEIKTANLEIKCKGKITGELNIQTKNIKVTLSNSSYLKLRGNAECYNIILNKLSKLDSYNLLAKVINITITGSGNAEVTAIDKLNINITNLAKVFYMGEPKEIKQSISGSAKIVQISQYFPANKTNIVNALIKKAPELKGRNIKINIEMRENQYARGKIIFNEKNNLDKIWLATLTNNGWIIVHEGNNAIFCEEVNPYHFPLSMVEKCYDLNSKTLIERKK